MTFLIGSVAVVLLLALVNWVACFFGIDVAGVLPSADEGASHSSSEAHDSASHTGAVPGAH